jgi:hypothetical protein
VLSLELFLNERASLFVVFIKILIPGVREKGYWNVQVEGNKRYHGPWR